MVLPAIAQTLWSVLQFVLQFGALAFLLYLIQQSFLSNPSHLNQRLRSPLAPPVPSAAPYLPPAPSAQGGKSKKKKKGKGTGGQDDAQVLPEAGEPEQVSPCVPCSTSRCLAVTWHSTTHRGHAAAVAAVLLRCLRIANTRCMQGAILTAAAAAGMHAS